MPKITSPNGTTWNKEDRPFDDKYWDNAPNNGYVPAAVWTNDENNDFLVIHSRRENVDFHPGMKYQVRFPDGNWQTYGKQEMAFDKARKHLKHDYGKK